MRPMGSFGGFLLAVSAGATLTVTGLATATASASTTAGTSAGTECSAAQAAAHGLPDFGNPDGHASVPQAGAAVNTSHPDHVIGAGTPAGCSAAVVKAVARGGIITFDCGPNPVTITMTATAKVVNTSHQVVLDGGGLVTLSGGGKRQILYMNTCDKKQKWTTSDCYNQQWPQADRAEHHAEERQLTGPANPQWPVRRRGRRRPVRAGRPAQGGQFPVPQ